MTSQSCSMCNNFFTKIATNQKFCSKSCYYKDRYNRKKESILKHKKEYYEENKTKINNGKTIYKRNKRISDTLYKLKGNLRSRFNKAFKGNYKTGSAISDLGCSIDEFKVYLENQLQEGMSWDNYGLKGWHIDHIIPLDKFDLFNPEEQKKACHYTNLQPMWAKDNLQKGAK